MLPELEPVGRRPPRKKKGDDDSFSLAELESAMSKLTKAAFRYDSVRDSGAMRAFDGRPMNAASFQQQLARAFPSLRLTEPEAYALLDHFDNDAGGTIDGAEFMKTFFSKSFEVKTKWSRQIRADHAEKKARAKLREMAKARDARRRMDARYDGSFSEADLVVAREKICRAAEHYDADNTDAMPLTGFQGAEMHPAVFEDQPRARVQVRRSRERETRGGIGIPPRPSLARAILSDAGSSGASGARSTPSSSAPSSRSSTRPATASSTAPSSCGRSSSSASTSAPRRSAARRRAR